MNLSQEKKVIFLAMDVRFECFFVLRVCPVWVSPPRYKQNWGEGVIPGIAFLVPCFLLWGRLEKCHPPPPYGKGIR